LLVLPAALFFLSGAAALIYQVTWLRILSLVFGVTVYAASAVLTSFMAGLALGSWIGGRTADRVRAPLRIFAVLEFGIAASALAVPLALEAISTLYADVYRHAPGALVQLTVARLTGSAFVLLLPTTLMGASLPLLARHVTRTEGEAASRIGWLYAANTAGGIFGTALAGFVSIGAIGIGATTRLAALLNAAAGCGALALDAVRRRARERREEDQDRPLAGKTAAVPRIIVFVVLSAGFAGLALEVVWFRLLTLFLTATTYAFTTMLGTVLLGIAVGSAAAGARVRRSLDPLRALGWTQIFTGILVLVSMTALAHTYRIGWRTSGMIQACVVAMLPATLLMGAAFPFAIAGALDGDSAGVGRRVGVLYATNVCGAVAGSLVGGFLLVPWFGTRTSLLLLSSLYMATGCVVIVRALGWNAGRTVGAAAAVFLAAAVTLPDIYAAVVARRYGAGEQPIFRLEGAQTTVAVHQRVPDGRVLYMDGLHQANDTVETVRQHSEIGHLPMVLHPNPARALVVGVGGGVTAGAVAAHPDTSVEIVELSRSVVAALPYFAHVNGGLLSRPNVRMRVDDGRNFLRFTSSRYDVITADLIQPVHAGAGNLYSIEYFMLARRALGEGGLMMQWIGRREDAHYRLIMRTFLSAFPDATLWSGGELMVGSLGPLRISRSAYDRNAADPRVRPSLARVGLESFDALLARYTAGPEEMRRFVGEGPVLTDDRPLVEFHRSLDATDLPDISALRGDVARHVDN
jgi:spermidine synthase